MKYFFIFMIFCQIILNDKNQKINIKILNSELEDGQDVNIEINNNSKFNYCFVIDTSFYIQNRLSYDGNFDNFSISLCEDSTGKKISSSKEVNNHGSFNDSIFNQREKSLIKKKNDTLLIDEHIYYRNLYKTGFVNTLYVYKIESGKSLKLKIPFNLVIKYMNQGVHQYYEIDRSKKYKAQIEYLIKREYIEKYILKSKIDSLEKNGYKFFTGKIISNKIPLVLK